MSLSHAFRRLSVRCQQCRRSISTSAPARQQQNNATAAFADLFQNSSSQSQSNTSPSRPTTDALSSLDKPATSSPTESPGWSLARQAIETASASRRNSVQKQMALDTSRGWSRSDLERQAIHRRWTPGSVYAPHDLTGIEMSKWKKQRRRPKPKVDVVDNLRLHNGGRGGGLVGNLYKNMSIMSEYVTEMGRIRHSSDTNLRPVNQRRMARAVRRAIGVGILMPSTHRHPEILRMEMRGGSNRGY